MNKFEFYQQRKENLAQEYKDLRLAINGNSGKKNTRLESLEILAKNHNMSKDTIMKILFDSSYNKNPKQVA